MLSPVSNPQTVLHDPRTRVDELLLSRIPSFFGSNLFFDFFNLVHEEMSAKGGWYKSKGWEMLQSLLDPLQL